MPLKLTVLVIASDGLPIYAEHQALWRTYATSHPDVTVYFVRQREDVETIYLEGDTLWAPGKELTERVFEKTVAAFQYLPTSSYDFLVRTNLSSVWNFNRLLEFCATLPPTNVFCGVLGNPGLSGAGMILSPDVVTQLAANSSRVDRCHWDDIDFGKVAALCGIPSRRGFRYDPRSRQEVDLCWDRGYHFYMKDMRGGIRNVVNELEVTRYLVQKIYPMNKK
jgi:hypothetical protein